MAIMLRVMDGEASYGMTLICRDECELSHTYTHTKGYKQFGGRGWIISLGFFFLLTCLVCKWVTPIRKREG